MAADPTQDALYPPSRAWKLANRVGSTALYLTQATDEHGSLMSDGRKSNNQNSAKVEFYRTDAANCQDPQRVHEFYRSILGGWDQSINTWVEPLQHYSTVGGLYYAKDMVHETLEGPIGVSSNGTNAATQYLKEKQALVAISFETLPYGVAETGSSGFNPNWIERRSSSISERINTAIGIIVYESTGYPVSFGSWISRNMENIEFTFLRVKSSSLYGTNDKYPMGPATISQYMGSVNSEAFLGYAPDTLMFDGFQVVQTVSDYAEGYTYQIVRVNMLYFAATWQTIPSPFGDSFVAASYVGGAKIWPRTDLFTNVFKRLTS